MIELKKVEFGMFPFGTLSGMNVFHIVLNGTEDTYKDKEFMEDQMKELALSIKSSIEKQKLEEQWLDTLLGLHYVIFSGRHIMDGINIDAINTLYMIFSHMSLEVQKEKPAYQLRPVPMCYLGWPEHFTGKKMFYENFNLLFVECPLYEEDGSLINDNSSLTNDLATVEMKNHSFSMFYAFANTPEEVEAFVKHYVERSNLSLPKDRSSIVCDYKNIKTLAPIALKHGIRIFIKYPKSKVILSI